MGSPTNWHDFVSGLGSSYDDALENCLFWFELEEIKMLYVLDKFMHWNGVCRRSPAC